jgi:hypothetical protein
VECSDALCLIILFPCVLILPAHFHRAPRADGTSGTVYLSIHRCQKIGLALDPALPDGQKLVGRTEVWRSCESLMLLFEDSCLRSRYRDAPTAHFVPFRIRMSSKDYPSMDTTRNLICEDDAIDRIFMPSSWEWKLACGWFGVALSSSGIAVNKAVVEQLGIIQARSYT